MSARVTPGTADTASYASATISQEKLGAQKNVGQPQPDGRDAVRVGDGARLDELERSVIGSSSSGSSTVPSAAQTASRRTPFMPC